MKADQEYSCVMVPPRVKKLRSKTTTLEIPIDDAYKIFCKMATKHGVCGAVNMLAHNSDIGIVSEFALRFQNENK